MNASPTTVPRGNRFVKLLKSPLSNKVYALSKAYWVLRTRMYYRLMFKELGTGTVLYKPMLLGNTDCIEIGRNVVIRDGARLEAVRDPYGRVPLITIGSDVNIEQDVHIVCHSRIAIGSGVTIAGRCSVVDITHPFERTEVTKIGDRILDEDSFVEIGDGAFLGIGCVVLPNVRIGTCAVIGANSVVTRDVPDYCVAAGAPAKVIRQYAQGAVAQAGLRASQ